jgi:hypothetical protein
MLEQLDAGVPGIREEVAMIRLSGAEDLHHLANSRSAPALGSSIEELPLQAGSGAVSATVLAWDP